MIGDKSYSKGYMIWNAEYDLQYEWYIRQESHIDADHSPVPKLIASGMPAARQIILFMLRFDGSEFQSYEDCRHDFAVLLY